MTGPLPVGVGEFLERSHPPMVEAPAKVGITTIRRSIAKGSATQKSLPPKS